MHDARPRFAVGRERGLEFAAAFFNASRSGDLRALTSMLAADVTLTGDGGGKRPAGLEPLIGIDAVLKLFEGLAKRLARQPPELVRYAQINGLPGFVTLEPDGMLQTTAIDIREGRIVGIYVMRNPDKLRHLEASLHQVCQE